MNQWLYSYQLSWIYIIGTKKLLDSVDLDLISKVTAVEKLKIHSVGTSVFSENTVTQFANRMVSVKGCEKMAVLHMWEMKTLPTFRYYRIHQQTEKTLISLSRCSV